MHAGAGIVCPGRGAEQLQLHLQLALDGQRALLYCTPVPRRVPPARLGQRHRRHGGFRRQEADRQRRIRADERPQNQAVRLYRRRQPHLQRHLRREAHQRRYESARLEGQRADVHLYGQTGLGQRAGPRRRRETQGQGACRRGAEGYERPERRDETLRRGIYEAEQQVPLYQAGVDVRQHRRAAGHPRRQQRHQPARLAGPLCTHTLLGQRRPQRPLAHLHPPAVRQDELLLLRHSLLSGCRHHHQICRDGARQSGERQHYAALFYGFHPAQVRAQHQEHRLGPSLRQPG